MLITSGSRLLPKLTDGVVVGAVVVVVVVADVVVRVTSVPLLGAAGAVPGGLATVDTVPLLRAAGVVAGGLATVDTGVDTGTAEAGAGELTDALQ